MFEVVEQVYAQLSELAQVTVPEEEAQPEAHPEEQPEFRGEGWQVSFFSSGWLSKLWSLFGSPL